MWSVTPWLGLLSRFMRQGQRSEIPEQEAQLLRQGKLKPEDTKEDRRTWDWNCCARSILAKRGASYFPLTLLFTPIYRSKILKSVLLMPESYAPSWVYGSKPATASIKCNPQPDGIRSSPLEHAGVNHAPRRRSTQFP